MAKPYIKLDCDWMHDPKIILFRSKYGKAALVDVLTVFIRLDKRLSSQHRREYTVHIIMKNTIGQSRRLAEYLENRQMNVKAFRILSDEDSEQAELAVTLIANDGIESDEIIRRLLTVKGVTLAELESPGDAEGRNSGHSTET